MSEGKAASAELTPTEALEAARKWQENDVPIPPYEIITGLMEGVEQRDELLAAAKAALEFIVDDNPGGSSADAWVAKICDDLRAAITKREKGE